MLVGTASFGSRLERTRLAGASLAQRKPADKGLLSIVSFGVRKPDTTAVALWRDEAVSCVDDDSCVKDSR